MNKQEIIKTIEKYKLNKNDFILISSAPLVLRNIKQSANDIDLAVSQSLNNYLQNNYTCHLTKETINGKSYNIYLIDNILHFSTENYDTIKYEVVDGYKLQTLSDIIRMKKTLNRPKDIKDIKLINNYNINPLVLAYLGDAVYELYIRKYLINQNISKVNHLQKEAIKYVSAKAQSTYLEQLENNHLLTSEEINLIKRARNHKSHSSPKNTDVITYKKSTGLEALIGYLYLNNQTRLEEIIKYVLGE